MNRFRAYLSCLLLLAGARASLAADSPTVLEIESPNGEVTFPVKSGIATATNGVIVRYGDSLLTADSATINQETGEVRAFGNVAVQRDKMYWRGERVIYNFKTREMQGEAFRFTANPFVIAGEGVAANLTNKTYSATNAFVTTDDVSEPGYKIRGKRLTVIPGKSIQLDSATVYFGDVPVFYLPYYHRSLERHPNNFEFTPGYRSLYGPYLLSTFNSDWGSGLTTEIHADYRVKRGFGGGPGASYDLGKFGQGTVQYYVLRDHNPGTNAFSTTPIPSDRQRVSFSHNLVLRSNLTVMAAVNYQSDPQIIRDFFEREYQQNAQPATFLDVNQTWPNFSLDVLAQPKINSFFETVERLPDVKLSALRQQLGDSPFYYEGESSLAYLRYSTNALPRYEAARGDTFHQLLLPNTFFEWLNVTPRAGGRFTYYGETHGTAATANEERRAVFNTGVEVSFKASRVWQNATNEFFEVDGLRHIIEPAINYAYVPAPNVRPLALPQFDGEHMSLRPLPIEFPDYNSIDSIDAQNVFRFGLRNKIQTKRGGNIENVINWDAFVDWRVTRLSTQKTYSDLFSKLDFKPRSWLTFNSEVRYNMNNGRFNEADHTAVIQPGSTWSASLGHRYLRSDPTLGFPIGNNLITTSFYYRFNENWAGRISHRFEARDGTLEEQYYTVYRDLRSWTTAITFRVRDNRGGPTDFTVALTASLKAFPRFGLGHDSDLPSSLLGY